MRTARLAGFTGLAAAAAAAGTLAFSGTALAQPPVGGCPSGGGWGLVTTGFVIPRLDNGNFKDQNGDGLLCARLNPGQTAKNGVPSYTIKDNTNPIR